MPSIKKTHYVADTLFLIVFIAFQVCFLVQLYFTLIVHSRLASYQSQEKTTAVNHPVSVIICARNEQQNLTNNLRLILEQQYENFEVVVVNDCSIDGTDLVLRDFSARYDCLKVVTINEHARFKHGKKFAATLGIKAAKNQHLLFTDADCRPATNQWLVRMQQNFKGPTEIVLGYSPYQRLEGFVNRLIRFETFFTALNYLSFALSGNPYMGVGRNMGYKKSLFFRAKGFASHMHIPSGDDDLFVNQNANKRNVAIEIHPDTHVNTEPKKTISAYINQKLRHLGAGKAYKKEHQLMLGLQAGTAILFYLLLITLIFLKAEWWFLLAIFLLRLLAQLVIYSPIFKKLGYADLFWWFPIFDFIYYFFIIALSIITLFKKKVQWK